MITTLAVIKRVVDFLDMASSSLAVGTYSVDQYCSEYTDPGEEVGTTGSERRPVFERLLLKGRGGPFHHHHTVSNHL
jgi:hypothetical protein